MLRNKKGFIISFFVISFILFFFSSIVYNLCYGIPVFSWNKNYNETFTLYYGENVDVNTIIKEANYNYPWFTDNNIILTNYETDKLDKYITKDVKTNSFTVNGVGNIKLDYKSLDNETSVHFNVELKFKNEVVYDILKSNLYLDKKAYTSAELSNIHNLVVDESINSKLNNGYLNLEDFNSFNNLESVYLDTEGLNVDKLDEDIILYCNPDDYNDYSKIYSADELFVYPEFSNYSLMLFDEYNELRNYKITKDTSIDLATYEPEYTGWTFKGWSSTSDGKNIVNDDVLFNSDKKFYAVWEENAYNLKFNQNKPTRATSNVVGDMADIEHINYETKFNLPTNAYTLTGWTFKGWSTNKNALEADITDGQNVYKMAETNMSVVLYAVWEENTYNLSFDFNKPENSSKNISGEMTTLSNVKYEDVYNLESNKFTLTGWTFKGWAMDADATTAEFDNAAEVAHLTAANENVVLYAVWEENVFDIVFNANKPQTASHDVLGQMATISSANYEAEVILTENAYTLVGWTFKGWSLDKNQIDFVDKADATYSFEEAGTHTLYAVWEENSYKITFDTNKPERASNNVLGTMAEYQNVGYEAFKDINSKYSLVGFTQLGWSTNKDNTASEYSDDDLVNYYGQEITIYAIWKENAYGINFNSNKPERASNEVLHEMANVGNIFYENSYKLSNNTYTLTGWTFKGWARDAAAEVAEYANAAEIIHLTDLNENVTLYAIWTENSYNIKFNANKPVTATGNLTGEIANISSIKYETDCKLPANQYYISDAWEFLGWSTNKNATEKEFDDAQFVKGLSGTNLANVTLYAVWKQTHFIFKFNSNKPAGASDDVTGEMPDQYIEFGDATAKIQANAFEINDHWSFVNWTVAIADTVKFENNQNATISYQEYLAYNSPYDTIELKANWNLDYYNVEFDCNIPENVASYTFKKNDVDQTSQTFKFENVETTFDLKIKLQVSNAAFLGWYVGDQKYIDYTDNTTVSINLRSYTTDVIQLKGKWEQDSYQLTYALNKPERSTHNITLNGVESTDTSYTFKYDYYDYVDFECKFFIEGFTFIGWSDTATGSKQYDASDVKNGLAGKNINRTLYAIWQENEYNVIFDANKPSIASSVVVGTMDVEANLLFESSYTLLDNNYSLLGWTFKGWSRDAGAEDVEFLNEASISHLTALNEDITLYAIWEQNQYKVIFNENHADAEGTMPEQIMYYDSPVSLDEVKFSVGYLGFRGWSTNKDATDIEYDNKEQVVNLATNGNITLYAIWLNENKYKIEYNINYPSTFDVMDPNNVDRKDSRPESDRPEYGTTFTLNKEAQLPGYSFVCWSLTPDGTAIHEINIGKGSLDDSKYTLSLYAVWELKQYFIKYEPINPTGNTGTVKYTGDLITSADINTLPKQPLSLSLFGYTFKGWSTTLNGAAVDVNSINSLIPTSDLVYLYPIWEANIYTITYGPNGGTVEKSYIEVTYEQHYELDIPVKTGYKFLRWEVTLPMGGKDLERYIDDYNVPLLTVTVPNEGESWPYATDVTLIARWEAKSYKITYNVGGGNPLNPSYIVVTYDTKYEFASPTREKDTEKKKKYSFVQWWYDGEVIPIKGDKWNYDYGNIEIVAEWLEEDDGCVTGDTKVLLADGTTAQIRDLKAGDIIKTWNFRTGQIDCLPVSIVYNHGFKYYDVTYLYFSDGSCVKMINDHGFFSFDTNSFIHITTDNCLDYVGYTFAKYDDAIERVVLERVEVKFEYIDCYSLRTAYTDNFFTEGLLSITGVHYPGMLEYFTINDDMKYDEELMKQDIEQYGLLTYDDAIDIIRNVFGDDMAEIIKKDFTIDLFNALNISEYSILLGKGILTYQDIIDMFYKDIFQA